LFLQNSNQISGVHKKKQAGVVNVNGILLLLTVCLVPACWCQGVRTSRGLPFVLVTRLHTVVLGHKSSFICCH